MSSNKVSQVPTDWREVHTNWEDKMQFIVSNQFGCDVVLRIRDGDKVLDFKAHQFVLNMSSVLFEKLLQDSKNRIFDPSVKMLVLNLPNTNSLFFKLFLRFLYTRKVQLETFTDAYELYKLSKQYGITDLNSLCLQFISTTVAISNALEVKEFATNYNIDSLREECSNIIRKNTSDVLKMSKWKLEWVKSLLDEPELSISEIELFRLVETWINTYFGDVDNTVHRNYLWKTLINKFCFLNMTADEFLEGPVKTGMISKDESLAIIGHIVSDKKFHLPFPASFKKTKRRHTEQQERPLNLNNYSFSPTKERKKQNQSGIGVQDKEKLNILQILQDNDVELIDNPDLLESKIQSLSNRSKDKVDEIQQTNEKSKSTEVKLQENLVDRKLSTSPSLMENKPPHSLPLLTEQSSRKSSSRSTVEDDLERAHNFIKKTSFVELNKKRVSVLECNKTDIKTKGQIQVFQDIDRRRPLPNIAEKHDSSSTTIKSSDDKIKKMNLTAEPEAVKITGKTGKSITKDAKKVYDQNLQTLKKSSVAQNANTKNKPSVSKSIGKPANNLHVRNKSPNRPN